MVYDAKRGTGGDLAKPKPVVAYWLLDGDKDRREELNRIERERAYGFDVKPGDAPGTFVLTFRAGRRGTSRFG